MTTLATTPLQMQITILMYTVATLVFLAAAYIGFQNYQKTRSISNYWLMFTLAVGFGGALTVVIILTYIVPTSGGLEQVDRLAGSMFVITLIITAIETLTTPIEVTIK